MNEHANASIPADIREQFQRDDQGRVLFFTAPPVNTSTIVQKEGQALGHSARFLAAKAARDAQRAAKRKADEANAAEREEAAKKVRTEAAEKFKKDVSELNTKAMKALENQLALATKKDFEILFEDDKATDKILKRLDDLTEVQKVAIARNREREVRLQKQKNGSHAPITGMTIRLEEKY